MSWVPVVRPTWWRAQYTNQPYIDQSENACHARSVQPLMLYNPKKDMYSSEPNSRPPCWSIPFVARDGAKAPPGLGLY